MKRSKATKSTKSAKSEKSHDFHSFTDLERRLFQGSGHREAHGT